jgi:hypothetical protein
MSNGDPAPLYPSIQRGFRGARKITARLSLRIVDNFSLQTEKYFALDLRLFVSGMPVDGDV